MARPARPIKFAVTEDCPKKIAHNMNDPCGARCPQLPKVLWVRDTVRRELLMARSDGGYLTSNKFGDCGSAATNDL